MQCPSCQRDVDGTSPFCPQCGAAVDGSHAATHTAAAAPPRPPSTDPIDQARFIPGTMLAGRYRVVALLGQGGMGEVYRAEDLKLGQPVALKFLPEQVAKDPARLARFHQEVRLARQVSHPNVCRMYDVGEADGQPFLTMEYVDGEDLASLLRRIGRLPPQKAVQLARQLCAGLAAAHDRGVLHGDLKPANILVDGRGRIRVADFGLAVLAEAPADGRGGVAGTPAYMAPEQLAGQGPSMRSDVYALGLVLYELFTGESARPPGTSRGVALDSSTVTNPSQLIPDLDPAIDRVVLRCLEQDPARRPASAIAVAAALPGGDPLAAALAAGETPSPEMVAAAPEVGTLSPVVGLMCLAGVVAGLVLLAPASERANVVSLVGLEDSPAVMTERTRVVLEALGYPDESPYEEVGYEYDEPYVGHVAATTTVGSADRWDVLREDRPSALNFWYRGSPRPLLVAPPTMAPRPDNLRWVNLTRPPQTEPGMRTIVLDEAGHLTFLLVVPERGDVAPRPPDWPALFDLAGLPISDFSAATQARTPPVYADTVATWEGTYPGRPDLQIQVDTASVGGRPVYFAVRAPWTPPVASDVPVPLLRRFAGMFSLGFVIVLVRRNLRLGRSDRRGAMRMAALIGVAYIVPESLRAWDLNVPILMAEAATRALLMWLMYTAFEPHIRSLWPTMVVGWNRLLLGRLRDPLVGRDLLLGVLVGVAVALWIYGAHVLGLGPDVLPVGGSVQATMLLGGRFAVRYVLGPALGNGFINGVALLAVLLMLYLVLRRRWAAVGVAFALAVLQATGGSVSPTVLAPVVPAIALLFALLVRFGILPLMVSMAVRMLALSVPVTLDSSAPYVESSYLVIATILVIAGYGLHTALAGRPIVGPGFFGDAPART